MGLRELTFTTIVEGSFVDNMYCVKMNISI